MSRELSLPVPSRFQPLILPRASARQLSVWRKLATKKGRKESGQILLEGIRIVSEALTSGRRVRTVIVADDNQGRDAWRRLEAGSAQREVSPFLVSPRDMEKLTDTVQASGIACVMSWESLLFDPNAATSNFRQSLICDRIADPGNLGTLIRTAAGLGLDAVFLLRETAELTNPKTIRAAAGAFFHIPVYDDVTPESLGVWAKRADLPIIVADAHRGQAVPKSPPTRWALVIGGETIPLDQSWGKLASQWVTVPLKRGVESLNAAIAGAIIMDRLCRGVESSSEPSRRRRT